MNTELAFKIVFIPS